MDLKNLFMNPIVIAILFFYFIGMLIPKTTEKFTNTPQIITATALVQGGATLQQAMALGVRKDDYITATYILANKD